MIPARFAPVLFGLLLSGLMSLVVSRIATLRAAGLAPSVPALRLRALNRTHLGVRRWGP